MIVDEVNFGWLMERCKMSKKRLRILRDKVLSEIREEHNLLKDRIRKHFDSFEEDLEDE